MTTEVAPAELETTSATEPIVTSDDSEDAPSTEETQSPAEEQEGTAGEQPKSEAPKERTVEEIDALYESGKVAELTKPEIDRLNQSRRDREAVENTRRQEVQARRDSLVKGFSAIPSIALQAAAEAADIESMLAERDGRDPSEEPVLKAMAKTVADNMPAIEAYVMHDHENRMADFLEKSGIPRSEVNGLREKGIVALYNKGLDLARSEGEPKLRADLAKAQARVTELEGQVESEKAGRARNGSGASTDGGNASSGYKRYSQMTFEERSALTPAERDAAVAREAAGRT